MALLVTLLAVGIGVMCYPAFSNFMNQLYQTRAVAGYREAVAEMDAENMRYMLARAHKYNQKLEELSYPLSQAQEKMPEYWDVLNVGARNIMGYIDIEKANIHLPIYHGTDESVLQIGAGHMQGTSLPVGGAGTRALITTHRGLPRAELFTNIDKLERGDIFSITVLREVLYYAVEYVETVLPEEVYLKIPIVKGQDRVTLMTCTPYGVNTHRLLVQGRRTSAPAADMQKNTANEESVYAFWMAAGAAAAACAAAIAIGRQRKSKKKQY